MGCIVIFATLAETRTPSGTDIVNSVFASYSNITGVNYNLSSSVTNRVSDFIDFSFTSKTDNRAFIGTAQPFPLTLSNANNFSDKFRIRLVFTSNTDIEFTFHYDSNNDGRVSPGELPITETPPLGEGSVARLIINVTLPSYVPPFTTNTAVFEISSFRTNTMVNSRQYLTNKFIAAIFSNAVTGLWASDGVKTISDFDGSEYLDDSNIRISIKLKKTPLDQSSVRLWYSSSAEPDGPYGPLTTDRFVEVKFDGTEWFAIIPKDDPAIADGRLVRFKIEVDHVLYPLSATSFRFKIKARPDQGAGFNVFPTVVEEQREIFMTWKLEKEERVSVEIYDLKGSLVWKNDYGLLDKGDYGPFVWDCKNHKGNPVISGLYFVNLYRSNKVEVRKVIIK